MLALGLQQRGFQQRPQRRQSGVVVLHRHHRGEVVHGQVARVLDLQAERVLRGQRGGRAGHAAFQQFAFEGFAHARGDVRIAAQHERHQPERTAEMIGRRRQRAGQLRFVRTEGDDAAAFTGARGPRGQLVELAVQRPARAQQFHRIVVRADGDQVQRRGLRGEARQVLRDQLGQRPDFVLREGLPRHRGIAPQLQGERPEHVQGGGLGGAGGTRLASWIRWRLVAREGGATLRAIMPARL